LHAHDRALHKALAAPGTGAPVTAVAVRTRRFFSKLLPDIHYGTPLNGRMKQFYLYNKTIIVSKDAENRTGKQKVTSLDNVL